MKYCVFVKRIKKIERLPQKKYLCYSFGNKIKNGKNFNKGIYLK